MALCRVQDTLFPLTPGSSLKLIILHNNGHKNLANRFVLDPFTKIIFVACEIDKGKKKITQLRPNSW